jgi:hypothetical protein
MQEVIAIMVREFGGPEVLPLKEARKAHEMLEGDSQASARQNHSLLLSRRFLVLH